MNKSIVLGMLSALTVQAPCFTMAKQQAHEQASYQASVKSLHNIAQNYTDFLGQFGKQEPGDLIPLMQSLFAPDCKKIVNGKIVSKTIVELYNQILEAKEAVGFWTVVTASPCVANAESNTVVIHHEIPTEKHGTHVIMKFLVCDDQGLIKEINEVFNQKSDQE